MGEFGWELCKRAWSEILSARGTTLLGGVVLPAVAIGLQFLVKACRQGKKAFNKEEAIAGTVATGVVWILLFSFYAVWKVPEEIREEASKHIPAIRIPVRAVPKNWYEDYALRRNHERAEQLAAAKGWITKDRAERIREVLQSNQKKKCQTFYYTIGSFDSRQLEPIKTSVERAGWPKMISAGGIVQLVTMTIGNSGITPAPKSEPLSVEFPDSSIECAEVICKALSVPCHSSRGTGRVIVVIRPPS